MKVADMHCDTIAELLYNKKSGKGSCSLRQNELHIDLEKMEIGDYLVQNFAMFVNLKRRERPLEWCLELIDQYYEELGKNSDRILPAYTCEDIRRNQEAGIMSAVLTIEEGGVLHGNQAFLRILHRLGVRMVTLTWNYCNELGWPNALTPEGEKADLRTPNTVNGLTKRGLEMIAEMEQLGIVVDVSHLSDAGFYDVLNVTTKPFAASHSNARALCPHIRNLTDDMIRKLAQRGGVMGMNYCGEFLDPEFWKKENPEGTLSQIVDQILYIGNIGGYGCIGLGSDFDGIQTHPDLKDASFLPVLEDALWKAGLGQAEIEGIFYKNVLNLYQEVWKG